MPKITMYPRLRTKVYKGKGKGKGKGSSRCKKR